MPDYQFGRIYRIDVDDEIYVGSTTQMLCKRKQKHIEVSQTKPMKLYKKINERQGRWEGINITLIENYPCHSKEMLLARERYWIETLKATLNKVIPTRTDKEYYEQNKAKIAEYQRHYNKQNKEQVAERRKEHYEKNKAGILENNKQYYEKNKAKIAEQRKEYRKQRIICPHCQKEMCRDSIHKHKKNIHHITG